MKPRTILTSIFLMLIPAVIFCQPVSLDTIEAVALNANRALKTESNKDLKVLEIIPISKEISNLGHIVNLNDNSFILLSGDYSIEPILGYCLTGNFSFSDAPPGLIYLIEKYESEIKYSRNNKLEPSDRTKERWKTIINYPQSYISSKASVSPMLSTEWSQQSGYNYYCPYDSGQGANCPAGCTAVALAQILKYWECRVSPTSSMSWTWSYYGTMYVNFGTSTYDWIDMDDNFWDYENAWLIYSAGVGMAMKYGPTSSSSTPGDAAGSMEDFWGFSNVDVKWRIWHLSTWEDDLKEELDAGRPLLYSAGNFSLEGHSWVIDGYNSSDQFNCNWGWGPGWDGYYSLGDFELDGSNLNQIESAIFDAYPDEPEGTPTPILTEQNIYAGSTTINLSASFGATSYEWTTTNGTLTSTTTSPSNSLTTNLNTQVCIRAFNTLCNEYSDWDCETFTITAGPITGDNFICYGSNESYSLTNCPPDSSISWTKSSNLNWVGTPSGTNCTVTASNSTSNSAGWVKASVTNTDNTIIDVTKDVWVGKPTAPITNPSGASPYSEIEIGTYKYVYLASTPGASPSYTGSWSATGHITTSGSTTGYSHSFEGISEGMGAFYVTTSNVCGTSIARQGGISVIDDGGGDPPPPVPLLEDETSEPIIKFGPNPANTYLNITLNMPTNTVLGEYRILVYDAYSRLLKDDSMNSLNKRLYVGDLNEGLYIIHLIVDEKVYKEKFIIAK